MMTKTKHHVWLQDKVVYPPTEQPLDIDSDGEQGQHPWDSLWYTAEKFSPYKIGSEIERECPTCEGTGDYIEGGGSEAVNAYGACNEPSCTDGTQKRRIVSARLVEHTDFACTLESADDVDRVLSLVLDGHKYLIVAQTERAPGGF